MAPGLESYLRNLSEKQRARLAADSRKALRAAWPHRHTSFRAPTVIECNVMMLRNLREVF